MFIFNERHLENVLAEYVGYFSSFDRWVRNLGIAQARTPFRSPRANVP